MKSRNDAEWKNNRKLGKTAGKVDEENGVGETDGNEKKI